MLSITGVHGVCPDSMLASQRRGESLRSAAAVNAMVCASHTVSDSSQVAEMLGYGLVSETVPVAYGSESQAASFTLAVAKTFGPPCAWFVCMP